jgi:hypothetical protein
MLTLFKDYLTELSQLVEDGVTDAMNLVTSQSETPERLHSLSNQDLGRTMRRNHEELLGLPPGRSLSPIVRSEVEQIYNYYVRKQFHTGSAAAGARYSALSKKSFIDKSKAAPNLVISNRAD